MEYIIQKVSKYGFIHKEQNPLKIKVKKYVSASISNLNF